MKETTKMAVVMNHVLTEEQKQEAMNRLGVTEFIYMPDFLKKLWANIDPEIDSNELVKTVCSPIIEWIEATVSADNGDYVLIDGDACAIYKILDYLKDKPDYENILTFLKATSKRISMEETQSDGSIKKVNTFKHVRFRSY